MESPKDIGLRQVKLPKNPEIEKMINEMIKQLGSIYRLLHTDIAKIEKRLDDGGL